MIEDTNQAGFSVEADAAAAALEGAFDIVASEGYVPVSVVLGALDAARNQSIFVGGEDDPQRVGWLKAIAFLEAAIRLHPPKDTTGDE